jgi:hypothetical protein
LHIGECLRRFGNLLRQGTDFPPNIVLLVEVRGAELVEFAVGAPCLLVADFFSPWQVVIGMSFFSCPSHAAHTRHG